MTIRRLTLLGTVFGIIVAVGSASREVLAQTTKGKAAAPQAKAPARPASAQSPIGPQLGGATAGHPTTPPRPQVPAWYPLPASDQKYLDDVLNYWQQSSAKIKRYECQFTRWEYDGVSPIHDPKTKVREANVVSSGELKYETPDKGMLRVDFIQHNNVNRTGEQSKWITLPHEKGEHWICDGESIFAFDHHNKKLIQTELPPEMHGKSIVDGPLPFMFGAEAEKIKARFWVRVVTPRNVQGQYWLEAVPKTREDATNFKSIQVIIDEKEFLPEAMQLFDLNSTTYTAYEFKNRKVNSKSLLENLDQLKLFQKSFYAPTKPSDYTKVIHRYEPPPPASNTKSSPPSQAKRPTGNSFPR